MLMAIFIKAIGSMTKCKAKGSIFMLMEHNMTGTGTKICIMDKVTRSGKTAPSTRAHFKTGRSKDKASSTGRTAANSQETSIITRWKDKEFTAGTMVDAILEVGAIIRCTAMESFHSKTDENIGVSISKTRKKDRASSFGLMVENTKVAGSTESNMAKPLTQLKMVW